MSQKSSDPQAVSFASQALKRDTPGVVSRHPPRVGLFFENQRHGYGRRRPHEKTKYKIT